MRGVCEASPLYNGADYTTGKRDAWCVGMQKTCWQNRRGEGGGAAQDRWTITAGG